MAAMATGIVTIETLRSGVLRVPSGVRPMIRVIAMRTAVSVMNTTLESSRLEASEAV